MPMHKGFKLHQSRYEPIKNFSPRGRCRVLTAESFIFQCCQLLQLNYQIGPTMVQMKKINKTF